MGRKLRKGLDCLHVKESLAIVFKAQRGMFFTNLDELAPLAFIVLDTVSLDTPTADLGLPAKGLILHEGGALTDGKSGSLHCTSGHRFSPLRCQMRGLLWNCWSSVNIVSHFNS